MKQEGLHVQITLKSNNWRNYLKRGQTKQCSRPLNDNRPWCYRQIINYKTTCNVCNHSYIRCAVRHLHQRISNTANHIKIICIKKTKNNVPAATKTSQRNFSTPALAQTLKMFEMQELFTLLWNFSNFAFRCRFYRTVSFFVHCAY